MTNWKEPYSAGTKQPHIAMTVRRAICFRYVLLPDMLRIAMMSRWYTETTKGRTWVLGRFETMTPRSSIRRSEPLLLQTGRFRARDACRP